MNKGLRITLFALPLLLFVALAVLLGSRLGKDPSELPSARIGKPLPEFRLASLTDAEQIVGTADFVGQVALINVWATWCASCQIEHPVLMKIAASGVPILGVNYKDKRDAALSYLQDHGNPFRLSVFDDRGDLGLDLGVYGAPETYLIDKQGHVRYRFVGVLDETQWQSVLRPRYEALVAGKPLPADEAASEGGA